MVPTTNGWRGSHIVVVAQSRQFFAFALVLVLGGHVEPEEALELDDADHLVVGEVGDAVHEVEERLLGEVQRADALLDQRHVHEADVLRVVRLEQELQVRGSHLCLWQED